jgi:hypothetical protein
MSLRFPAHKYVHIGERALADLRDQWLADGRRDASLQPKRGATIGANIAGFGGTLGATAPTAGVAPNKYDDAHRAVEYLGDRVMSLEDAPDFGREFRVAYLRGRATFSVLFVPGMPGRTTHQLAYGARIDSHCDGEMSEGLLFLLASYRHSARYAKQPAVATAAFTPSSPEGLRYAFHIGRGEQDESFNPISGYEVKQPELGHLADEVLVLANSAFEDPRDVITCDFVAELHGAFHSGDEAGKWYPLARRVAAPTFTVLGAPLVLAEV